MLDGWSKWDETHVGLEWTQLVDVLVMCNTVARLMTEVNWLIGTING